ncbi:hypothetical protein BofuT4_uP044220.1 [Botrytis cinerea T4]|uniref:Uncharacterized protein n=1 Tax=Botryotinia fuckeliana (strain T4) TaxID=999810 RepID=G2XY67_BOTF4|nr:hypothetical protein BofuT4_uP044220.1 [Botrytis cinerea T4]
MAWIMRKATKCFKKTWNRVYNGNEPQNPDSNRLPKIVPETRMWPCPDRRPMSDRTHRTVCRR